MFPLPMGFNPLPYGFADEAFCSPKSFSTSCPISHVFSECEAALPGIRLPGSLVENPEPHSDCRCWDSLGSQTYSNIVCPLSLFLRQHLTDPTSSRADFQFSAGFFYTNGWWYASLYFFSPKSDLSFPPKTGTALLLVSHYTPLFFLRKAPALFPPTCYWRLRVSISSFFFFQFNVPAAFAKWCKTITSEYEARPPSSATFDLPQPTEDSFRPFARHLPSYRTLSPRPFLPELPQAGETRIRRPEIAFNEEHVFPSYLFLDPLPL